ncbi:neogenin-like [Ctenocephalides felis]|uniref:neogenin-like n=1 Tax=Ctenocephalides felis TaxID=7515 RepID=UPI000E6E252A|nr:neogenin-like [Ctenocephalides felis]
MIRTRKMILSVKHAIVLTLLLFLTVKVHTLEFTQEPEDTIVQSGKPAILNCAAKNPSAPSAGIEIRWRGPDGQDLNFIGETYRSQLSNGSLYFNAVVDHQGLTGNYQCMATVEPIGTIVSHAAKLSIASFPAIELHPIDQSVPVGQTAFFTCLIVPVDRKIKYTYVWLKDERPIKLDSVRMTILPSGALEIDDIVPSDKGSYRCNVTDNNQYRLSHKAILEVERYDDSIAAPVFIALPQTQIVIEGDSTTFDCAANGNPKPSITWLKNGEAIDLNDLDSRFRIIGTGSLQISNIRESDSTVYQCRAQNNEDSLDATANLNVQVPPRFTIVPSDKIAIEKEDIELECAIYGIPQPKVQWLKNGETIKPNDYMQIVKDNNLKILGLMGTDAGIFQCIGTNPTGSVQGSARLSILGPNGHTYGDINHTPIISGNENGLPGPPRDLVAYIVKTRFVTLKWSEPEETNGNILGYSVYYRLQGSQRERVLPTKSKVEEMVVAHLQPAKVYMFRVVANNSRGPGISSQILAVTTQAEEDVSGPPVFVKAEPLSPTKIKVSWQQPTVTNGDILKYKVYYMEADSTEESSQDSVDLTTELVNLLPYTTYNIYVVAVNNHGIGTSSSELTVRTYSDIPTEPPSNVTLEPTSTSITVHWEPPPASDHNGIITGYKIKYRKFNKKKSETSSTPANVRFYVINNLDKMTGYQIKLCALNVNGSGPYTEWHHVETYENDLDESSVPGEPSPLKVRPASDSITVSWNPPRDQYIKVRSYILGWGNGIPDVFTQVLDDNARYYVIKNLEPNCEYVISLKARNEVGDGPPVYSNVRTREEAPLETSSPLVPPVGLKAVVLSSNAVVVYWTDTTLSKSQYVTDKRHYTVRFTTTGSPKYRYHNSTELNLMIDDLRPNTQYEFTVKVVKGKRESPWSMEVLNTTQQAPPSTPPRDLAVLLPTKDNNYVTLQWQPPRVSNGPITGYVISYSPDNLRNDRDWLAEAVVGDKHTIVLKQLTPNTKYYFKVKARNDKGYGPFSSPIAHFTDPIEGESTLSGNIILYCIIGGSVFAIICLIIFLVIFCRRNSDPNEMEHNKSYQKNNASNIKPPDLWIHHDQMELKALEKGHSNNSGCNDGASSSGAMTLPRSVGHEYDQSPSSHPHMSNSLDKRTYVPGFMVATTPVTSSSESSSTRPTYPRTQYSISRAHVTLDQNNVPSLSHTSNVPHMTSMGLGNGGSSLTSGQNISSVGSLPNSIETCKSNLPHNNSAQTPENPYVYDTVTSNYSQPPVTSSPYAPVEPKRAQGHPLKSFSVPAPPTSSTPNTPNTKHNASQGINRPQNASPYKKPLMINRLQAGPSVCHSSDEVQRLAPSHSTEELHQEMANLEGLMKDLNAITANEFEC